MYAAGTSPAGFQARHRAMADNVEWLLEQAGPGAKIALWAHNGHVSNQPETMGSHLRKKYGEQMVIFGFDFYQGSFRAVDFSRSGPTGRGVVDHTVGRPAAGDSYEAFFHLDGHERLIIDLRTANSGSIAAGWLKGPRRMRTVGSGFAEGVDAYFYYSRLSEEFDVIVYFENTSPSIPVR